MMMIPPITRAGRRRRLIWVDVRVTVCGDAIVAGVGVGVDGGDRIGVGIGIVVIPMPSELTHHPPSSCGARVPVVDIAAALSNSCVIISIIQIAVPTVRVAIIMMSSIALDIPLKLIAHDPRTAMSPWRSLIESHRLIP